MNSLGLAGCLALLAYGAAMAVGSALVLPALRPVLCTVDPDARSRRLFALRWLPAALGLVVSLGLVLPTFLWIEPVEADERIGVPLALLAGLSAASLVTGIVRGGLDLWATRRLIRRLSRTARPIELPGIALRTFALDEPFPFVAIAGCLRLRLFVSSVVLDRCTTAELAAIAAHESGHLRRGDPWRRLLLRACPDLLAFTPFAARLERSWTAAAEQAADDYASAAGVSRSLDLASALLKVARLAGSAIPQASPLIALYRGNGVAGRVARLLAREQPPVKAPGVPGAPGAPGSRRGLWLGATLAAGLLISVAAAHFDLPQRVHELLEAIVRGLS